MNQNLKKRDFARARSLFKRKDIGMKRYFMAFIGVILIGFNVTLLNLSGFGVDTFSCMNMAVSEHLMADNCKYSDFYRTFHFRD